MDPYDVCIQAAHDEDLPTFKAHYSPEMGRIFKTRNGLNLIHRLALKGRPQFIEYMMSVYPTINLNVRCMCDMTALMYACREGHVSTVQEILKHGASLRCIITDECPVVGYTAMALAIRARKDEMVRCLLEMPQCSSQYEEGHDIVEIEIATKLQRLDMLELMLSYDFMKSHHSLSRSVALAINMRNLPILQLLFKHIDIHDFSVDGPIPQPLFLVVSKTWIEGIDYILSLKPNLNVKTRYFGTILHEAVCRNRVDIVQKLLDADVDRVLIHEAYNSDTALSISCKRGYCDIVALLLQYGANPNEQLFGKTMLMYTIYWSHDIRICTLLIQYGADIHTSLYDQTASFWAVKLSKKDIQLLLHETELALTCSESTLPSVFFEFTLDYETLAKIIQPPTLTLLHQFVANVVLDERACYTALHESEDAALQRYRTDQDPNFSKAMIRGMGRPLGMRNLRRLLTSYLVYPKKNRERLNHFRNG
jgi:ankyrin repeat protein